MSIVAKKVLKRLREESPEVLKDSEPAQLSEIDIDKIDVNTALPSEIKKLSEQIARRRLTAPGLTETEAKALLRRHGLK